MARAQYGGWSVPVRGIELFYRSRRENKLGRSTIRQIAFQDGR